MAYHDGSWQRVENNATLTLEELVDSGDAKSVGTSVDVGRSWNRVAELTEPDDSYELATPVGTAAVRGTAFATECPDASECTFSAVEGTVVVTPTGGEPVTLVAPAVLTVRLDEVPGAPEVVAPDVLRADTWIKKNLELDGEQFDDGGEEGAAAEPTAEQLHAASIVGTYDGVRTGVSTNYLPSEANYVAAGSTADRTYEFAEDCGPDGCTLTLIVDGGEPQALAFDGEAYVQRVELSSDCLDHATGELLVPAAATLVAEARWAPAAAELVGGEWVVTAMEGDGRQSATAADAGAFDSGRCFWNSVDGTPYVQEVVYALTRRN